MDTTFSRRIPKRGETVTARILKLPDGRHAAEIISSMGETEDAVLWSRVFKMDDSIATITGRVVAVFDYLVGYRVDPNDDSPRPAEW